LPVQLARDEKFDHVLQRMYEAPSTCLLSEFLEKEDFYSNGSTLLHYISARGRMSNALSDAMIFCAFLGQSLDILDSNGLTALHIAVRYDRIENVLPLLTHGAMFDTPNPDGELPMHVAVTDSKDENLVKKLLWCRGDVMDTQVVAPSTRAGQVVLDLMVERVLREMMHSGKAEVSPTTKEIFSAILTVRDTVTDTIYIRKHAQANHRLFLQATLAIGNLPRGKGGRLGLLMMKILRKVCKENGWEIPEDAQYNRILPFAWQSTNSKVHVSLSY
jgi:ankyrin repeat protein